MMQRGLALKPPYGTVFTAQPDGSIWLIYETTAIDVNTIVNWLRDIALEHQAQCVASDEAIKAYERKMLIESAPKISTVPNEQSKGHIWNGNGAYRLGAKCLTCGTFANGLESRECK
jgi:hypothetical protein